MSPPPVRHEHSEASCCQGKERYQSFGLAEKVAKRRMRCKGRKTALQPYRCPHCHGFHIGSR